MSVFGRDVEDCPFWVEWNDPNWPELNGERGFETWAMRGFTSLKDAQAFYDSLGDISCCICELGTYQEYPDFERLGLFYFMQNKSKHWFNCDLEELKQGNGVLWFNNQMSNKLISYKPKEVE